MVCVHTQDEPVMEPCFNVLAFDVRNNQPLNRRKGFDNPAEEASAVKHRALPETVRGGTRCLRGAHPQPPQEEQAPPLGPLENPTFGKPVLEEGHD